jgi:hypothetical protein
MCLQFEWDQSMHPILVPDLDGDSNDDLGDNFERNVRLYLLPNTAKRNDQST